VDIQGQLFEEMGDETRAAAVPRIGLVVAANLRHLTGVPWAADDADLVAGRGCSKCCSSRQDRRGCRQQTLLDVRVSRAFSLGGGARIELLVDMLNALNDKAEEGLVDDNLFSSNFRTAERVY